MPSSNSPMLVYAAALLLTIVGVAFLAIPKQANRTSKSPFSHPAKARAEFGTPPSLRVWVNSGEDKVTRDELRKHLGASVINSVWDGKQIHLFAACNETVAFNLVLESPSGAEKMSVEFVALGDFKPELFYVRYLAIKGVSALAYSHYDERHVPQRFRRPHDPLTGRATGGWLDRPDHDKQYPDIAVPLELHSPFDIAPETNQSIWCDLRVPKDASPGGYSGSIVIRQGDQETLRIPTKLQVLDFTLPDKPTAKPFLHISTENINKRYLGKSYPEDGPKDEPLRRRSREIIDRHFQMAKQHSIALITEHTSTERLESSGWLDRLRGTLFTPERGYEGRGEGIGNGIFAVGTYGVWKACWEGSENDSDKLQAECRTTLEWFKQRNLESATDLFLYLIDESTDFAWIEEKATWVAETGLPTLATLNAPEAIRNTPTLTIACSTMAVGRTDTWSQAVSYLQANPERRFWMYNGFRPASGTLTTEDDGIALRELVWGQYKMGIERWFVWEGAYYDNYQGGTGETNVFQSAHIFGGKGRQDNSLGETGWNYQNGDGVLFYPGTDTVFPAESYDVDYPFASLRLKHWRRGIQDHDYLVKAHAIDPTKTASIVDRLIPRVLWENGVNNSSDPTYASCDISWPTDPDVWEAARRELAAIITRQTPKSPAAHETKAE